MPIPDQRANEPLEPALLEAFTRTLTLGAAVLTLADGKPNWVIQVGSVGITIETDKSRRGGSGPQLVPAWMFNVAWRHLLAHGSLAKTYLLATEGLNIKPSSAVCALLAELPTVRVASSRPIRLELLGET